MSDSIRRKEAIRAYKERDEVGAVFRYIHETGWESPLLTTPNLAGKQNMLAFSKKTNSCTDSSLADAWSRLAAEGFGIAVVETLKKKPELTAQDFREELLALRALHEGNADA